VESIVYFSYLASPVTESVRSDSGERLFFIPLMKKVIPNLNQRHVFPLYPPFCQEIKLQSLK